MPDDECVFSKTVDKPPAKDKAKDSEVLNTEKEKKRIARQKERRATLILGELCVTTGSGYKVRDDFSFFSFSILWILHTQYFGIPLCMNPQ